MIFSSRIATKRQTGFNRTKRSNLPKERPAQRERGEQHVALSVAHPEPKPLAAYNPTPSRLCVGTGPNLHRCFCWPRTWVHGNECSWTARHQRAQTAPPISHRGVPGQAPQSRPQSRRKAVPLRPTVSVGFHQNHQAPSQTTGGFLYCKEIRPMVRVPRHRLQVAKPVETAAAAAKAEEASTG